MSQQPSPEIAAALDEILAPHTEHRFGACGADLCADCCSDLGMAISRGAERARLKAAVLALAGDSYVVGVSAVLALFEVES